MPTTRSPRTLTDLSLALSRADRGASQADGWVDTALDLAQQLGRTGIANALQVYAVQAAALAEALGNLSDAVAAEFDADEAPAPNHTPSPVTAEGIMAAIGYPR